MLKREERGREAGGRKGRKTKFMARRGGVPGELNHEESKNRGFPLFSVELTLTSGGLNEETRVPASSSVLDPRVSQGLIVSAERRERNATSEIVKLLFCTNAHDSNQPRFRIVKRNRSYVALVPLFPVSHISPSCGGTPYCVHEYKAQAPHSLFIPAHMKNKITVMAALGNPVPEILLKSVRTAALQLQLRRGSEGARRAQETTPIRPGLRLRFSSENTHISKREDTQVPYSFGKLRTPRSIFTRLKMGNCMEEDAAGGQERAPQSCSINVADPLVLMTIATGDDLRRSDMAGDVESAQMPFCVTGLWGPVLSLRSPNDGDVSGSRRARAHMRVGYLGCEHRLGVTLVRCVRRGAPPPGALSSFDLDRASGGKPSYGRS
ncbi:hypothetical protein EDB86DRAFT_2834643 [Lactarius hatsudake]|nr:hypothetical protein EDB86DRAFT_2834643 [Lactarius hatsudake]